MLGQEELAGHLGPNPRPIGSRKRSVGEKADRRLERPDASNHLKAERANIAINDSERRAQPRRILVVAFRELRPSSAVDLAKRGGKR
jgi:hypothetical protein